MSPTTVHITKSVFQPQIARSKALCYAVYLQCKSIFTISFESNAMQSLSYTNKTAPNTMMRRFIAARWCNITNYWLLLLLWMARIVSKTPTRDYYHC